MARSLRVPRAAGDGDAAAWTVVGARRAPPHPLCPGRLTTTGGPREGQPQGRRARDRRAGRRSTSHDLVQNGGLAEPAQGITGEIAVDLAKAEIDLPVGEGEEAPPFSIALHQEGPQPLDLQHP